MNTSLGITLRLAILASVLIGMPLLAIPGWQDRIASCLQGVVEPASDGPTSPPRPESSPRRPASRATVSAEGRQSSTEGTRVATSPTPTSEGSVAPALLDGPPLPGSSVPAGIQPPRSAADQVRAATKLSPSDQQRLQELGATYLVVEHLEHSGLFRCLCLVQVPGTGLERPFEAEDLMAERALHRVLVEVEHWALARQSAVTASRHPEKRPDAAQRRGAP